ncbi:MAG: HD domain-containing protein [Prevotella sp.]|nr:HD domain-containing protein [Prevotella sp.]
MDYVSVIKRYYKEDTPLWDILLHHSRQVAGRALSICDRHPEWQLDRQFIEAASMLHDIGITRCDAPGIACFGTEPYIRHGLLGGEMLRQLPLEPAITEPFARICERHTGAGITTDEIRLQHLPLPERDLQPETLAEQLVCYADKFYSKSHLEREKTIDEAARSLRKFGEEGVVRFLRWAALFEDYQAPSGAQQ